MLVGVTISGYWYRTKSKSRAHLATGPSRKSYVNKKLREHVLANRQSIAYALGGFSTGVLGTLFEMFNVMFFTRVVGLDNSFFYTGHIVYGIWNAVNDPAFGWLIDHTANRANRRLPVIKYGGPLWCFFYAHLVSLE